MRTRRPIRWLIVALAVLSASVVSCTQDGGRSVGAEHSDGVVTTSTSTTAKANSAPCHPDVSETVASTSVSGSPTDVDVTSFDGTRIRAHWFPGPADGGPRPTVLMGPGWGMAGDTDADTVGILGAVNIATLRSAGYNVLTWDPRGFGESGGVAMVDSPEYEARDVQQLLTWVSHRPEAQIDAPLDPTVGMVGGSYGGGIQFVTAGIDCRVDALVPIVAWHSLITSLYKSQTYKQGWAEILSSVASNARLDPMIGAANEQGRRSGVLSQAQVDWFEARGPGDLVSKVAVPTMVVGGTVDTLFTLAEDVTNLEALQKAGTTTSMYWFCGGHGTCLTDAGDPERMTSRILAWLKRWVQRDESVDVGPAFEFLDQHGTHYTADAYPLQSGSPITGSGSGALDLAADGGSGPASVPAEKADILSGVAGDIIPAPASRSIDVAIPVHSDAMVLGAPRLELRYSGTSPAGEQPTRLFAQLVDRSTGLVVGNQVTPVPVELDGKLHTVEVPLEVVAQKADPSSDLVLQLAATTTLYGTPRLGGSIAVQKASITLPTVTGYAPL